MIAGRSREILSIIATSDGALPFCRTLQARGGRSLPVIVNRVYESSLHELLDWAK